jgi:selenocysteine-specific elongation factor
MPQTSEHLAIIDLLGVHGGVIALTKSDLVQDRDWWNIVESEARACVHGTVLQDVPIVRFTARTRDGLPELLAHLSTQLGAQPDRPDLGRPRLSLDRVFSMEGFGTVVTGTLTDGQLAVGDEVEILPSGHHGRIRGLQNHRRKVERAWPGARTAVNISGIAASQLQRGQVLVHPGQYAATRRVDAHLRVLQGAGTGVSHNREVKVFLGTAESIAVLRLLDADEIHPGAEGLIQLEFSHELVCARGDRFILRRPSPPETLGGGDILNAHPPGRHKRFDAQIIASLRAQGSGQAAEVLYEVIQTIGAATVREILERSRLEGVDAREGLHQLLSDNRITPIDARKDSVDEDQILVSQPYWGALSKRCCQACAEFHLKFPLRAGLPREELKHQLGLAARTFGIVLERLETEAKLTVRGSSVALPGHQVLFDAEQQRAIAALLQRFKANPFAPPSTKACAEAIGSDVFSALKDLGQLVAVSDDVVFRRSDYDSMVDAIRAALEQSPKISLAEVRDLFGTSRKYAQALLEHLDSIGITRRDGDLRVLAR